MAPTPRHLAEILKLVKQKKIGLVVASQQRIAAARRVAKAGKCHAQVVQLTSSTTGPHQGWFAHMDHVVDLFARHLVPVRKAPVDSAGSKD